MQWQKKERLTDCQIKNIESLATCVRMKSFGNVRWPDRSIETEAEIQLVWLEWIQMPSVQKTYLKAVVDILGAAFCYTQISQFYLIKNDRLKETKSKDVPTFKQDKFSSSLIYFWHLNFFLPKSLINGIKIFHGT